MCRLYGFRANAPTKIECTLVLAQNALLAFAEDYRAGRYDRSRGRLRSWLFGIVHRQLLNHWRRSERRGRVTGLETGVIDQVPERTNAEGENELEQRWEDFGGTAFDEASPRHVSVYRKR